jgi:phage baseplate assembly protein W
MDTFALEHGDFVIDGSGGYALLSGADRIRQDLSLALLEEYGSDRFHPKYGSVVKTYIGNVIDENLQQLVKAEVNRVVTTYIGIQQAEVLRDSTVDIAGRFTTSDVVRNITGIDVHTTYDTIYVAATLETLARETVTITQQVTT